MLKKILTLLFTIMTILPISVLVSAAESPIAESEFIHHIIEKRSYQNIHSKNYLVGI